MEIREYREADLEAIVRLFYDTVHVDFFDTSNSECGRVERRSCSVDLCQGYGFIDYCGYGGGGGASRGRGR